VFAESVLNALIQALHQIGEDENRDDGDGKSENNAVCRLRILYLTADSLSLL
jgi:hypothetical protein